MTKQEEGIHRQEVETEQEVKVREWDEGLPSLADLISLSQCLISPQLASAFSITSPSPTPARSSVDVNLASHTAFTSLQRILPTYSDLVGTVRPDPQSQAGGHLEISQLNAGDSAIHGVEASFAKPHAELFAGDSSPGVVHVSEKAYSGSLRGFDEAPIDEGHLGEVSTREWHGKSQPMDAGHCLNYAIDTFAAKYQDSSPVDGHVGGEVRHVGGEVPKSSENGGDGNGMGEGGDHRPANAGACISVSSDVATRTNADNEAEEAESTPSPAENQNAEAIARTLKRPRLVWTPELHKRFVDTVSHLGVKTAVPKTIMQLMNVEGLTRENVASHLQKYRLYLKRMQGLSNEGPTSSDHLFSSTPIPPGFATPGRVHTGMPAHLQDHNQVPFVPSHNPVSMGRGHVSGIMSGPFPPVDPLSFNLFAKPPSLRFVQGDVQGLREHSLQHVPKK